MSLRRWFEGWSRMKVRLDIPIFATANVAWGTAAGEVDLTEIPAAQDMLVLPVGSLELTELGFPPSMLVQSVLERDEGTSLLLYGVVAKDAASAARIGEIFESEKGWDVWQL